MALLIGASGCFLKPDPPLDTVADAAADDLDASVDGAGTCSVWGPWATQTALSALNSTGEDDYGVALSKDELQIVWTRGNMLMEARRSSLTAPWTDIRSVSLFGFGGGAHLSGDGLTLYFHKYESGGADIMTTTRSAPTASWPNGTPLAPFNTPAWERDLELSWNGLDAVLYVGEMSDGEPEDIAIASRVAPSGPFGAWSRIPSASRVDAFDCCPGISPDGLEVYWEVDALWRVRRTDRDAAFGPAEMVPGLDDPGLQYGDPHFNAIGNRLYLGVRIEGSNNYDLHVAERTCAD